MKNNVNVENSQIICPQSIKKNSSNVISSFTFASNKTNCDYDYQMYCLKWFCYDFMHWTA